jgi:type IV secretion system protein VirB3
MSAPEEMLDCSPLFTVLTRPPMILGVTIDYICIIALFSMCLFIITGSPLYGIVYIPLHVFGWIACKVDVNFFRVITKLIECPNTLNKKIWGCKHYEPF